MSNSTVKEAGGGAAGFLIGPAFLVLAAWFVLGPNLSKIPETKASLVPRQYISTAPRREALTDPPTIMINGYRRTCRDCHDMFPPRANPPAKLLQHSHVVLNHGINDACRNCHDVENRNRLVLYSGESISYAQVVELCAKCHGPTYEDWRRGMHGKTLGYWDTSRGERRRLKCVECHDPHNPRHPAMEPLRPLPPPNTLRMGDQTETGEQEVDEVDPLRRALHLAERILKKRADEAAEPEEEVHP